MKKILILLFISFGIFGQGKDSFRILSKSRYENDTAKCSFLNKIIEEEPEHTIWINYNHQLLKVAQTNLANGKISKIERIIYLKYLSIAYLNEGAYNNYIDKYRKAIYFYKKSLSISLPNNFYETSASNYQNIGTAFDYLGKLDSCLIYFTKALSFAKKSNNQSNIAYVMTDLGFVYNSLGNHVKAIELNIEALKIFESFKDYEGIERTCFAIGRIFDAQREYIKSEYYYLKCLKINREIKNLQRESLIYNSLCHTNILNGKYEEAKNYAKESLNLSQKNNFEAIEAMSYRHLGEIYFLLKQDEQALKSLKYCLDIFKRLKSLNNLVEVQILLGKIYFRANNDNLAKDVLIRAYNTAKKNSYPLAIRELGDLLSQLFYKQNDFKSAYKFQTIAKRISDSLFIDENKNIALKTEFKYETEAKDNELIKISQQKQISELESTRKTTLIYSILGGILALSAIAYFSFTRFRTKKENELLSTQLQEAERRIEIEQKATESELKALKSQMNPHFMFNALNGIQEQFMYGDKTVANEQMGNFTYLTRQILTVSGKKKINLSTEIEILTKYLELEKMRFAEGFDYAINLSENIDEDYHQIPPMLIQPFVENSIKHGLLHKKGDKKVSISFDLDAKEENLICVVEDNGVGREKSAEIKSKQIQQHESFSTSATEERLRLLGNNLNNKDLVIYEDLKNEHQEVIGTRVVITIALG